MYLTLITVFMTLYLGKSYHYEIWCCIFLVRFMTFIRLVKRSVTNIKIYNMTTVINNPSNGESTGVGMIVGIVLVLAVILGLFYYYGFPGRALAPSPQRNVQVDVNLPTPNNNNNQ